MAAAYREKATAVSTARVSSLACNKPAGTVSGDVLVAIVTARSPDGVPVFTAPAGWVAQAGDMGGGEAEVCRTYTLVCGGAEPATYTWTITVVTANCTIIIACYSGVDNTTPMDVASTALANFATANCVATGVTTVTDSCMLVYTGSNGCGAGGMTWTPPGGMTEAGDVNSTDASYNCSSCLDYVLLGAHGATGNKTGVCNDATRDPIGCLLALRPAAAAASQALFLRADEKY